MEGYLFVFVENLPKRNPKIRTKNFKKLICVWGIVNYQNWLNASPPLRSKIWNVCKCQTTRRPCWLLELLTDVLVVNVHFLRSLLTSTLMIIWSGWVAQRNGEINSKLVLCHNITGRSRTVDKLIWVYAISQLRIWAFFATGTTDACVACSFVFTRPFSN